MSLIRNHIYHEFNLLYNHLQKILNALKVYYNMIIMYERFYDWANDIGMKIVYSTGESGTDLIKKIIFDIRGEQLPGKFLEKLMTRLAEYRTDRDLNLVDIEIDPEIFGETLWGNSFHYTKSAIIAGLLNAIASQPKIKRSEK